MIYKAENIDTEKAIEHLDFLIKNSITKQNLERAKIEKYYEGYRDGIEDAKNMFYCSNYEKEV